MDSIGIIAAMPQERDALLKNIKPRERARLGPYRCHRFRLAERDCWLLTSGMGPKRAAQAAETLIEAIHPQLLVSVGVAGAVHPDLAIGDVLVSRNVCLLDGGQTGPLRPLAMLSETAWQAATRALQPGRRRLLSGTAVTTHAAQSSAAQIEGMVNPILEMETSGIAQAAEQQGIPLLSVRGISDGPSAPLPFEIEAIMDDQYNLRMGKIIQTMLCHPRSLSQYLLLGRNTRQAAENAAMALIAALGEPEPVTFIFP
jgi:adenosylhomocysteine nucleosidase